MRRWPDTRADQARQNAALICFDVQLWKPSHEQLFVRQLQLMWPQIQDYEHMLTRFISCVREDVSVRPAEIALQKKSTCLHVFFLSKDSTYLDQKEQLLKLRRLSLELIHGWQRLAPSVDSTPAAQNARNLAPVALHLRSLFEELIDITHHDS